MARTVGHTESVTLQAETGVDALASSWVKAMELRKPCTIFMSFQSAA